MNKLTAIKIKYDDGTYSDEIPISVLSENVEWDSTHTLVDVLGSIDVDAKGTIQAQIDKLSNEKTNKNYVDSMGNGLSSEIAKIENRLTTFETSKLDQSTFSAVLGNVDVNTKGTIQSQIDKLSNEKVDKARYSDFISTILRTTGMVIPEKTGSLQDQIDRLSAQDAGAHNSIYRGKNLGTSVTDKQWAAINAGTFDDLYIGDYWAINNRNWRIAAFDYYLNTGDTKCTTHHVVIVPDTFLGDNKQMNSTNTTAGGYTGSEMYTKNLADAKTLINNAFGSAHILNHRQFLTTAADNGKPSNGSWFDSTVELMTEQNVYGGKFFAPTSDGSTVPALYTIDKSQFPLFALEPSRITNRTTYWLRDVVSAATFALIYGNGFATYGNASDSFGVRPAFSIKS